MEIPDHIYTIAQQLFQALSKQQLDMEIVINNQIICYRNIQRKTKNTSYYEEHLWEKTYYGTNKRAYKRKLETMDRTTSNIILLLPVRSKVEYLGVVYRQIQKNI
ncbi:hypothetical protein G9A89_003256 [Geosiphon pyriformis]|nr:hypothetical protein G9A89_003256 [Geosiphon pyriformis]